MLGFQFYLWDKKGENIQSMCKKVRTFKGEDCFLSLNMGKSKSPLQELLDKPFVLCRFQLFSGSQNQAETSKMETF